MATRVIPFAVTIPTGTTPANPHTQALVFDNWEIERIDLEVPPGPGGIMGFQLYNNGVAWLPYGLDEWFVWDDVKDTYYLTDQPTSSGWSVVGYNEGAYPHTVIVRMHVNPVPNAQAENASPVVTINSGTPTATEPVTLG